MLTIVFHYTGIALSDLALYAQFTSVPHYLITKTQRTRAGDRDSTFQDPLQPFPYPGRDAQALPYPIYSGLIGLLCTSGANLSPGKNHY
jgi:hypothetical protein